MPHFTDTSGHKWGLDVTFSTLKRVKRLTGVDLFGDRHALIDTLSDMVQTVDVIYSICKPEADRLGMTDVDFGEGFSGETVLKAREAFAAAMVDFTPPDRRGALTAGINALLTAEAKMIEAVSAQVTSPEWQAEMDQEMEQMVEGLRHGRPSMN